MASLLDLPDDILANVVARLSARDIVVTAVTCSRLQKVCNDEDRVWLPKCKDLLPLVDAAMWLPAGLRDAGASSDIRNVWPPVSYKTLLARLLTLDLAIGLWSDSAAHQGNGAMYAFQWTPSALVCFELNKVALKALTHPHDPVTWSVTCVLNKESADLPVVELIDQQHLIVRPATVGVAARAVDEAKVLTALGSSLRDSSELLGSSPTASFEAEMLAFMSGQSPGGARKRRHRRRRSGGSMSRWTQAMNLSRVIMSQPTADRPYAGLWHGIVSYHGLEVVRIEYTDAPSNSEHLRIECHKLTGDSVVPAGCFSWQVHGRAELPTAADEHEFEHCVVEEYVQTLPASCHPDHALYSLPSGGQVASLAEALEAAVRSAGAEEDMPADGLAVDQLSLHNGSDTAASSCASADGLAAGLWRGADSRACDDGPARRGGASASGASVQGQTAAALQARQLPTLLAVHRGVGAVGRLLHDGRDGDAIVDGALWVLSTGHIAFYWGEPFRFAVVFSRFVNDFKCK